MKLFQHLRTILSKVFERFPCVLRSIISFPFDEVLPLSSLFPHIQDSFDVVPSLLLVLVDLISALHELSIRRRWFEQRNVKHWVHPHVLWQLQPVVDWVTGTLSEHFDDLQRSNLDVIKLLARPALGCEVFPEKEDLISLLQGWSLQPSFIKVFGGPEIEKFDLLCQPLMQRFEILRS
jgi:hypothetical protein